MRKVRSLGLGLCVLLGSLTITMSAFGWLYWMWPAVRHWPGPKVHLALPLDVLPSHDSVPLVIFLAAWGVTAALLGGLLRKAHVPSLAAAAALAIGVGAFVYAVEVFSYYFIQGNSKHASMVAAAHLWAVYIAAAMAGVGGGVLGMRGRR